MFDELDVKPPYTIPSMDDVRAAEGKSDIIVASTFSGMGGTCLGWRMAGADVRYALEFVEEARRTYIANHPHVHMDARDIRNVRGAEVVAACGGRVDVFEGSPPCASFSTIGAGEKLWGKEKSYSTGKKQRTDDLVSEWIRLGLEIQPKVMVMENVAGLGRGRALEEFLHIALKELSDNGYVLDARILLAHNFGVPQLRSRLFVQAFRSDLKMRPSWPTPSQYKYMLRDALDWAGASPPEELAWSKITAPCFTSEAVKLKPGQNSEKYFEMCRLAYNEPVPTITATKASRSGSPSLMPDEDRIFTPTELRAVFGVPRDFILTGPYAHQGERLGRCVAPPVSRAIAKVILEKLTCAV